MVNIGSDRSPERAREDYIKAIYQLGERRAVRAADLARYLGVTRASVSKFKRMLERERLLEPSQSRMGALRLTKKGRQLAVRMVRRHRLVETFLHTMLHVPLERVHVEAERIEHVISDDVSLRLDRFLSHPDVDPHGHKIPGSTRSKQATEVQLVRVPLHQDGIISSIDDRNQTVVAELRQHGVLPGCHVSLLCAADEVRLRLGAREICLSRAAGEAIRCYAARRKVAA